MLIALYTFYYASGIEDSRTVMDHAPGPYYVPHGTRWPIFGSVGLFLMLLGAALWLESSRSSAAGLLIGFGLLLIMLFGLVRHRDRRERAIAVQRPGRPLVPAGE